MTQNPYAQFGQPGFGGEILEPMERRTSVLAVLALIAGLLCFLPGAGVLALILGGAAVILIGQSRGRLGGLGMAITGIVLGLLFSILWIGVLMIAVSVGQMANQHFFVPVQAVVTGLETGDKQKARSLFTRTADVAITDAQIDDFAKRIHDEWGASRGTPASILEMIQDFMQVGDRMKSVQGKSDVIPMPVHFEKGTTVLLLEQDTATAIAVRHTSRGTTGEIMLDNIGVIAKDGSIIWLIPPEEAVKLRLQPGPKAATPPTETPASPAPPSPPSEP